ncbi:hypothetical protein BKA70DRAFT_1481746 [Coprinopsis sp. MPI-PUGE-AT-0042]|nr:hypothetical protein BKA70DRAFT_1481746 [Coprinopsis sp. MPI-PUGE-AT-0042]
MVWQMNNVNAQHHLSASLVPISACTQTRAIAIKTISTMSLLPLEKIVMVREFCVSSWLSEGATSLVGTLVIFNIESRAHHKTSVYWMQHKATVSMQYLARGCICGGHKYEEVGPPAGFGFSSARKSISGYRVIHDWASLLPSSTTSTDSKSAISAAVTKLFGGEIQAMKAAV